MMKNQTSEAGRLRAMSIGATALGVGGLTASLIAPGGSGSGT